MNGYIRMEIQAQSAGGDGASPCSDHVCPRMLTAPSLLQHFFTSFGARDRCFLLIFRLWQNALLEKVGLGESGLGIEVGGDPGARRSKLGELEGPFTLLHGHRPALPTASCLDSSRDHHGPQCLALPPPTCIRVSVALASPPQMQNALKMRRCLCVCHSKVRPQADTAVSSLWQNSLIELSTKINVFSIRAVKYGSRWPHGPVELSESG